MGVGYDGRNYMTFFGDKPEDIETLGECFDDAKEMCGVGNMNAHNVKF